ncbi:MAG TPA: flagellar biosynthetic protein FliO [Ilumatobacteraceae bacterium]
MTRWIVVTLLLAAVAIALKLRTRGTTTTKTMKVTSRAALSRGAVLVVVEVEGRRLLIGAAPNQVNLIAELDPADTTVPSPAGDAPTTPRTGAPARRPISSGTVIDRIRHLTVRTVEPGLRLTARESGTR